MSPIADKTLAKVLDAAPDAILSVDVDGVVVMANVQAQRLFRYDDQSLLGIPMTQILPIEAVDDPGDRTGLLMIGSRGDGSEFLAEVSLSTLIVASRRITTVIVRDVSARGKVEAERIAVKSEAEGVRLNAEAALVKAESEKATAEGVRIEAEVQRVKAEDEKQTAEGVRLDAEAALVKAEGEKATAERVRLEAEVQRVKAEGEKAEAERVRLEAEVQRVKAEGEKAEAERVRLEAEIELERLEGQLHQSQRMESLGQLAGGVAHDFNNLLAVILNYASFVTEELKDAVASPLGERWEGPLKDVTQIQVAAERASVLTHQLLTFARREVIQARALSFNEAIRNIEEILHRTIGEQIELTFNLEPDLSLVFADPGHIEQIILNLAINARDAMPEGGKLSIETSSRTLSAAEWPLFGAPPGSYVCVRISDNGTGMSAEVRDRAFEPFFTTKPRGEGSGLGLATVYGIVLQSEGFAKIYSDEGVGTTITVLLPIAADQPSDADKIGSAAKTSSPGGTETVLVVDDEEGLREVARRILIRNGYVVLVACSGKEAAEIAATYEGSIDLILTDVIMPVMQGPAVVREVKKLRPYIKVLFMSGHALPVLEAEAVLGTNFQLVEKPFDEKMLLGHVRRALKVPSKTPSPAFKPDDISPKSGWVVCTQHHNARDYFTAGRKFSTCLHFGQRDRVTCQWRYV
jgi:PAS domain S-box-containing protein